MSDVAIRVEGLCKQYHLGGPRARYSTFRDQIRKWTSLRTLLCRGRDEEKLPPFWALKDVSFEVKRGDVVGIIGRNGAGKSTLLKILSRITEPTEGAADIYGRVGSLLEVGTGFHPELTGRENIYLNGAILGMRRAEITRKFDEIVAFAEVEKFIDTPVKHYSSGMYMRLAFAVAAHLEPEILVVDEVLAVGDDQFQKKCIGKMQDVAASGRTVLFVSHNMPTLRRLTQRCVYLRSGKVECIDQTSKSIDQYLAEAFTQNISKENAQSLDYYRRGERYDSSVRIQGIRITTTESVAIETLSSGNAFRLELTLDAKESHDRACLAFWLSNERGERVGTFFSGDAGFWFAIRPGRQMIACTVRDLPLAPGRYLLTVGVNRTASTLAFDVILDYPAFTVTLPGLDTGEIDWAHRPWGAVHWDRVAWSSIEHFATDYQRS